MQLFREYKNNACTLVYINTWYYAKYRQVAKTCVGTCTYKREWAVALYLVALRCWFILVSVASMEGYMMSTTYIQVSHTQRANTSSSKFSMSFRANTSFKEVFNVTADVCQVFFNLLIYKIHPLGPHNNITAVRYRITVLPESQTFQRLP